MLQPLLSGKYEQRDIIALGRGARMRPPWEFSHLTDLPLGQAAAYGALGPLPIRRFASHLWRTRFSWCRVRPLATGQRQQYGAIRAQSPRT
jgi:hypothetical protein